jgi:hypothetical protein
MITRVRTEEDYTWDVRQKITKLIQSSIEDRNRGCKAMRRQIGFTKEIRLLRRGHIEESDREIEVEDIYIVLEKKIKKWKGSKN